MNTFDEKLVIPSRQDRLVEVDELVGSIVKQLPFSEDACDDIAIAVSEGVNNAIIHGNKFADDKTVGISIRTNDTSITITITDQGEGFVEEEVPDPTNPENMLSLSGRGLFIIRHLMDKVEVESSNGGTTIHMTKYFKPQEQTQ